MYTLGHSISRTAVIARNTLLLVASLGFSVSALGAEDAIATPEAFVTQASQHGKTGVALSNLALKKSKSPQVQEFARRMVTLNRETTAGLSAIARARGIEIPEGLDSIHAARVSAVDTEVGASFDYVYTRHMSADHSRTVAMFEEAANSQDVELAQFARKILPALKAERATVRKLVRAAR